MEVFSTFTTLRHTESHGPKISSEYHMKSLRGGLLTDSPESFRQGAGAFRNAGDWAKEQRDKFIRDANDKAQAMST